MAVAAQDVVERLGSRPEEAIPVNAGRVNVELVAESVGSGVTGYRFGGLGRRVLGGLGWELRYCSRIPGLNFVSEPFEGTSVQRKTAAISLGKNACCTGLV